MPYLLYHPSKHHTDWQYRLTLCFERLQIVCHTAAKERTAIF